MDAGYTGNKISQLRKQHNMTQKELASMLSVTDKAVSKWERGLNFPDLMTMEKIAEVLHTSVIELLGIEQYSAEQVVAEISDLAAAEKQSLLDAIRRRALLSIILGTAVYTRLIYISKDLYDNGVYHSGVMGVAVWMGIVISNSIVTVKHADKLMGKQTVSMKIWRYIKQTRLYALCVNACTRTAEFIVKASGRSPINKLIDRYFDSEEK